ncbi:DUF2798 domain-containing protein [Saccharobesus litoralis]|uniref:DUF2798 domain-containing protein n=1 Tax=Saccharobesus litoralis TaxID=2172099 RepID=A0A2S0VPE1_9ALTE|nr:DUF2798 domain-containing protein [Saccharobesus litoralis]AWB66085.1 DUF2798 domain-containing protein [Saccharobesus litoralis]
MKWLSNKANLAAILMAFFMSGVMSAALEFVFSNFNLAFMQFISTWALSFVIALPTVFLLAPIVDALATKLAAIMAAKVTLHG